MYSCKKNRRKIKEEEKNEVKEEAAEKEEEVKAHTDPTAVWMS